MKISRLTAGDFDCFIYLERYVNEGSPSGYGLERGLQDIHLPSSNHPSIEIPVFWLHFEQLTTVGHFVSFFPSPSESDNGSRVPFPVHPAVLASFGEHLALKTSSSRSVILVQPLASGRTVAYLNDVGENVFIKLHFPQVLGRFNRALPLYKWLASLENSKELCRGIHGPISSVSLFPYVGGAFLETDGVVGGGGFLLRSVHPFPPSTRDSVLIPAFSLWSMDKKEPSDDPLLIQLVRLLNLNLSGCLTLFVRPLLESYGFLALRCGFLCEDNAQNVVFEISNNFSEVRVVRRDMADVFKDEALRVEGEQYPLCTYHSLEQSVYDDLRKRRSFAFDFKLSRYIIDPLINCLERFLGWNRTEMQEQVRSISKDVVHWPEDYFPANDLAYGYPKEESVNRSSYVELQDEFLYR